MTTETTTKSTDDSSANSPRPDLQQYDFEPLSPMQELMVEDGMPRSLILSPKARAMAWLGKRPKSLVAMTFAKPRTKDEDPATTILRKEVEAAERKKREERFARLKELKMATKGPKELQVAALREERAAKTKTTKTAPAPAAAKPAKPAEPAKEKTVKTSTKKAAKPAAKKAATSARRQKPARAASAARPAAQPKEGGVRPGSKLELIVGLLKRPEGCTTADVLAACNWPSVSMPQQAKAAGIKLVKEKVDGVTVYRAA